MPKTLSTEKVLGKKRSRESSTITAPQKVTKNSEKQSIHLDTKIDQWLFYDGFAKKDQGVFWNGSGVPTPKPTIWANLNEVSKPRDFHRQSKGRAKRGIYTAYNLREYTTLYGSSKTSRPSDHYNPFGRFSTTEEFSFLPNPKINFEQIQTIENVLSNKANGYKQIMGLSREIDPSGYPSWIIIENEERLPLNHFNDLGALYSKLDENLSIASSTGEKKESPSGIPKFSEPFKIIERQFITSEAVASWSGQKRLIDQKKVMNCSAGEAAEAAGYIKNEGKGWEWLHLIAHSMGGIKTIGPQRAENLVAGTSECNTQMIIVEEFIKDLLVKGDFKCQLAIIVKMKDPDLHIGDTIKYHFAMYKNDETPIQTFLWSFNCLSRENPFAALNRVTRIAGRAAFGVLDDKMDDISYGGVEKVVLSEQDKQELIENEFKRIIDLKNFKPQDLSDLIDFYSKHNISIPKSMFIKIGIYLYHNKRDSIPDVIKSFLNSNYNAKALELIRGAYGQATNEDERNFLIKAYKNVLQIPMASLHSTT